jgi:CHAD domain-containing protein
MAARRISAKALEKPAHKVIRHQAERLVTKAHRAVHRLGDPQDAEALHDSRVALRRLRGWFQAFREELPLKRKWRRALKQLAHSTNDARDAEVCLVWLSRLKPQGQADEAQFRAELEAQREESYRTVRKELPPRWHGLARKLSHTVAELGSLGSPFRQRFAASLQGYARDFERARVRARRRPIAANIHALRIAGKKLRYLVDVVLKREAAAKGLMGEVETLHDAAGTIQDLQRLQALVEQDFLKQADRRYRRLLKAPGPHGHADLAPEPGPLLRICRAARREQMKRIAHFRKSYLGKSPPRYVRELHRVMRQLGEHDKVH